MTKQEIIAKFRSKSYFSCGLLEIDSTADKFDDGVGVLISYDGNMGNTIETVNERLADIGLPSIAELKAMFPQGREHGSPDYAYTLELVCDYDR